MPVKPGDVYKSLPAWVERVGDWLSGPVPIVDLACRFMVWRANKYNETQVRRRADIHPSVVIGEFCKIDRQVRIGRDTYVNAYSQIFAGAHSKVDIGEHCAIGYNVHIKARTHDTGAATGGEGKQARRAEADITIGDRVWIGDNAFIREGVVLGAGCIVGANAVVTRSFGPGKILAGVPAKAIGRVEDLDSADRSPGAPVPEKDVTQS